MKIGLCLPQLNQHADRTAVSGFAKNAEAAGFDSLWVQDHFMVPEDPQVGYAGGPTELKMPDPYRCMLSPLETLAFVAAITERAQIGTSILVTAYYRPLMLAKRLASIDILSGGRLVAGLGLGWSKDEYDQMDTPFARRGARMTDFIRALKACWLPDPVEYRGEFFEVPRCDSSPKPLQRNAAGEPQVEIAIGGGGNAAGQRRIAELGDAWNPAGAPPEMVMAGLAALNELAKEYGREPLGNYMRVFANPTMPGIEPWHGGFFGPMSWSGTAEEMRPRVEEAREAGIGHVIIETGFWEPCPSPQNWVDQVEFFAPLVDAAHG